MDETRVIPFTGKVGADLLNFAVENFYLDNGLWYQKDDNFHWTLENIAKSFIKQDY